MKRSILLSVFLGLVLLIGSSYAASPPGMLSTVANVLADSDGDGVDDSLDLCPGTPSGVAVNAYGCPLSLTSCDYTTSTVTLNSTTGTTGAGITTRYVLASNQGIILALSNTPSFSGLTGSQTYMALAFTFEGSATNLTVGQALSAVTASCFDWSDALVFRACISQPPQPTPDADQDGVSDDNDLCPNTPLGVAVNAYGCPLSVATCDYSTSAITLNTTGGTSGTGVTTRYVLASNTGTILQTNTIPSFNGLSGTATYMVVAITYDGSVTNLSPNQALSAVTASCFDWSDALVIKVCVSPPVSPTTCDYQLGQTITLNTTGGTSGTSVQTRYVLTNASNVIVQVQTTPSFATTALTAGAYKAYAVTYENDGSLVNLSANGTNTISAVSANCFAVSAALALQLCDCDPKCVPITIERLR